MNEWRVEWLQAVAVLVDDLNAEGRTCDAAHLGGLAVALESVARDRVATLTNDRLRADARLSDSALKHSLARLRGAGLLATATYADDKGRAFHTLNTPVGQ